MKRRTKILIAAAFVLVLGFMLLKPSGGHRRALEEYKKELRAKGEKLTMIELAPPRSASGSNFSVAFSNAMAGYQQPLDSAAMMQPVLPGIAMIMRTNVEPTLMLKYESNVRKMNELRAILKNSVPDFGLDYSLGSAVQLLPAVVDMKRSAILASDTVMQALNRKDYAEAWQHLLTAVELITIGDNEPLMIIDLVRNASASLAMAATWETLQAGQLTEPQLAGLQAKWETVDLFKPSEKTYAMETAFTIDSIEKLRNTNSEGYVFALGMQSRTAASPDSTESGPLSGARGKIGNLYDRYPRFWMWKSSWSYGEELFLIQAIGAARETSRKVQNSSAFAPALTELYLQITNITQSHPSHEQYILSMTLGDAAFGKYLQKMATTETGRRLLVTVIALERYKLNHGTYPTSLGELVPKHLKSVPLDFMDGKPLRYQLKADGSFLLYSVGKDGKDNIGDSAVLDRYSRPAYWLNALDIIWPRAATPEEVEQFNRTNATARPGQGVVQPRIATPAEVEQFNKTNAPGK